MIAPVRWLLGRVAACATRAEARAKGCACQWEAGDSPCLTCAEERIDEMEREETRLRGELRAAIARAEKAEGALRIKEEHFEALRKDSAETERHLLKARAQIARWRPLVEAARRFVVAWRDEGSSEAVEAQRWIIHAVDQLDAGQEGGGL